MPKVAYIQKRFNNSSVSLIETASQIIDEYEGQGFDLTLRQLYYQMVARDYIPNNQKSYKRLGSIINDARLAGLIDWYAITDRTRYLREVSHWSDPASVIRSAHYSYRIDKWEGQPHRPEVWIEKDALVGVISRICTRLDIPYFSCRGYTSQSEMWQAGERLKGHINNGQMPVILHLGDHDPSGIDMSRDIEDRLTMFTQEIDFGGFAFERIALNYDQIERYDPPPNPAKITDSRAKGYIAEHGGQSWELDALDPNTLTDLIQTHIDRLRDDDLWAQKEAQEEQERDTLKNLSDNYHDIVRTFNF